MNRETTRGVRGACFFISWVLSVSILLTGCGGGEASVTQGGIGPNGGVSTSNDGRASVSIPVGALSQETAITVAPASSPPLGNIGTAYEFGPSGTVFGQVVTISIFYDESTLSSGGINESDLRLGTLTNGQWQAVAGSVVDTVSNNVSGGTTSFSFYGVIAVSSTGIFSSTGSMGTARQNYTATLLPGGKVLVAGGFVNTSLLALASAELYDPATGTFSPTGSLRTARALHTATLLPNGKVLIAGGFSSGSSLSSAEIYDPATGTFGPTGSMSAARADFPATLLSDGRVLIAGGSGIRNAELYDPASGTFTPTGSMNAARVNRAATLLPNGKVLIAGGFTGGTIPPLASAELYDPATGTFSLTGSMSTGRDSHHTATLLPNGKVLIAGGFSGSLLSVVDTAELYDPATGTFSPTGDMSTARASHTATLLPTGNVLIAGGVSLASAELYDTATGVFSPTANMNTNREIHRAVLLLNGKVLVAGGFGSGSLLASAELFQ